MIAHGIDLNTPEIHDFCRRWKINQLCVFGSVLRDDFGAESDIDFLADYEEDAEWDLLDSIRMQEELGAILGRKADVVDRYAIEHDGNRFVTKEIFSTAEPVYGKR